MNEKNFKGVDLNLLVVFVVLMRERSATRTGQKLGLSQSAVSHALRRLRTLFNDVLFVLASKGIAPTPRGEAIYQDMVPLLEAIELKLRDREPFDPAVSARTFRLGLPSSLNVWLVPLLLDRLAIRAPKISLIIRTVDLRSGPPMLDTEDVDFAVSHFPGIEKWHMRRDIGECNYACVFDIKQVNLPRRITLKQYLDHPHVLASFGGDRTGVVDDELARAGKSRRVAISTSEFSSIPFYLMNFKAIATLPTYAARAFARDLPLICTKVPLKLPNFMLSMIWHVRFDDDQAHRWLRNFVFDLLAEIQTVKRV
jgi:LysR family transcriptional regulator, mexEF-oprN operon transcriptional activator